MEHRHLGRLENGKFVPNKACALLFSKDPCQEVRGCRIRFLKYEGNDEKLGAEYNVIKDQWIEGNIPSQLVQAERLIESQLREFSRLGKDGKFATSPEYPKAAWYEGVVNAVCHRSYNLENIPIFIKMFDDRLEFQSPGGFLPFVTPDNIYDISHPRNPDLMMALHYLEYVKCANEGTKRMRKTMTDLDLPAPIFSEKQSSHIHFQATLKNNVEYRKAWIDSDAAKVVGEMVFQSLTERERRIINYAAENKKISVTDAVRITEAAWETCKSTLLGLCNKGILLHVHRKDIIRDPDAHFILNTNPKNIVSGTMTFRPATRKASN